MTREERDGALVVATDVTVTVDKGQRTLLDAVNLVARAGEVVGLIGPNGAGKSTLLAALAGDLETSGGSIRVGGMDPMRVSPREMARVRSMMLQEVSVAFSFLVRDVVEMGRRPWRGTDRAAQDAAVVDAALVVTATDHLADRDIMTLSGGERARVAMARVLAQQTEVVFLDEPTAALDIRHQEQTLGIMRQIAASGAAVIVVLHDLEAAAAYCDRVVCLKEGVVAATGTVAEVYQDAVLSSVYDWPIAVSTVAGRITVHPQRTDEDGAAALPAESAAVLFSAKGHRADGT